MTVDPSSLIFVVIVAIWAAYLLGHWVRRRDQVATVRSVDRFSEAMRVLERRPAVRSVPLSRPSPRSYVVAPARPAPAQVSVKRAPAVERPAVPQQRISSPDPVPAPAAARPAAAGPAPARPARAARPSSAPARGRAALAVTLLALLVATPVSWLLAAFTQAVRWWVPALVTLALVAVVAHLRRTARQARELARRRERLERRHQSQARRQSRRAVVGEVVAAHRDRAGQGTEPGPAEVETSDAAPVEATTDGWQPVPVPPPTYTLKPKAPPRVRPAVSAPAAATPAAPAPTPVPTPAAPTAPAFDLDEILERRIASGS